MRRRIRCLGLGGVRWAHSIRQMPVVEIMMPIMGKNLETMANEYNMGRIKVYMVVCMGTGLTEEWREKECWTARWDLWDEVSKEEPRILGKMLVCYSLDRNGAEGLQRDM